MTTSQTGTLISGIYAKTLFALAEEQNLADAVKDDMESLTRVFADERDCLNFIISPYFPSEQKQRLIRKIFSGAVTDLTMSFLKAVIKHNRMRLWHQMVKEYYNLWNAAHGLCPVKVTVSKPLDKNEIELLYQDISAAIKSEITLDMVVDPSIMGGIIINYGDMIVVNTVKARLCQAVQMITSPDKRRVGINEV